MASQTTLIVIGIVIIVLILIWKTSASVRQAQDKIVGICATAIGLDTKKQENKNRILSLLGEKGTLSNSDVRGTLGISERSVVRYMNELEKEGRVEQVGSTGRNVVYRLKT